MSDLCVPSYVAAMSIKELKSVLDDAGVSYKGLTEKAASFAQLLASFCHDVVCVEPKS